MLQSRKSRPMPLIWSQFWINYELICAAASFGAVAALMAFEVWKKIFVMLSPNAP